MPSAPTPLEQARQARLQVTENEKPWNVLRAEAFPSVRQRWGFLAASTITVTWGLYLIISNPAVRQDTLLPCFIMSIAGLITLAVHAHRQKKALLTIIRQESPDLYRKILRETA